MVWSFYINFQRSKTAPRPPISVGSYGTLVTTRILAQALLTESLLVCNPPSSHASDSQMCHWRNSTSVGKSKHGGGEGQQKLWNGSPPFGLQRSQANKSRSIQHRGEMAKINATLKEGKDTERMVPIMSSFNTPVWVLQEIKPGGWKETFANSTKKYPWGSCWARCAVFGRAD